LLKAKIHYTLPNGNSFIVRVLAQSRRRPAEFFQLHPG